MIQKEDRLFVPLNKKWYNLFLSGDKTWEIRAISSRFNTDTVKIGRRVELRNGYQKKGALVGKISNVITAYNIFKLPRPISNMALPAHEMSAGDWKQICDYNNKYDRLIVFEIKNLEFKTEVTLKRR